MRWAAALKRRFAALRLTERIHRRTNFQRGLLYIGARRALMGGKWTPLDYFRRGEQGAWYDPSDLSTLFQDAAGTIPVTAVEQPVGLMLDKSGRGNHARQTTTTSRPTLRQDANGKYYLYTDGIDDFMVTNSIDFTATDKMTVICGVRKLSNAGTQMLAELSTGPDIGSFSVLSGLQVLGDYGVIRRASATAANTAVPVFSAPGTQIISIGLNLSGTTALTELPTFNVNRVAPERIETGADSGTGNFGSYPLYLFRRAGTSLPANVYFYGLIVRGAETQDALLNPGQMFIAGKTGVVL